LGGGWEIQKDKEEGREAQELPAIEVIPRSKKL